MTKAHLWDKWTYNGVDNHVIGGAQNEFPYSLSLFCTGDIADEVHYLFSSNYQKGALCRNGTKLDKKNLTCEENRPRGPYSHRIKDSKTGIQNKNH